MSDQDETRRELAEIKRQADEIELPRILRLIVDLTFEHAGRLIDEGPKAIDDE